MAEPKRYAKMDGVELDRWVIVRAGETSYPLALAALRDAIRAEALRDEYELRLSLIHRAERAEQEQERDALVLDLESTKDALRTAESALATEREDNRNLAAQIEATNGRAESALGEARRGLPDWEFPAIDDSDAQLVVMSFANDHQMTAKVVHRSTRQFVTLGDVPREMFAPATPSGEGDQSPESPDGCLRCGDICKPWCHNAPQQEPLVIPVEQKMGPEWWMDTSDVRITITPAIAAEIVKMGGKV